MNKKMQWFKSLVTSITLVSLILGTADSAAGRTAVTKHAFKTAMAVLAQAPQVAVDDLASHFAKRGNLKQFEELRKRFGNDPVALGREALAHLDEEGVRLFTKNTVAKLSDSRKQSVFNIRFKEIKGSRGNQSSKEMTELKNLLGDRTQYMLFEGAATNTGNGTSAPAVRQLMKKNLFGETIPSIKQKNGLLDEVHIRTQGSLFKKQVKQPRDSNLFNSNPKLFNGFQNQKPATTQVPLGQVPLGQVPLGQGPRSPGLNNLNLPIGIQGSQAAPIAGAPPPIKFDPKKKTFMKWDWVKKKYVPVLAVGTPAAGALYLKKKKK